MFEVALPAMITVRPTPTCISGVLLGVDLICTKYNVPVHVCVGKMMMYCRVQHTCTLCSKLQTRPSWAQFALLDRLHVVSSTIHPHFTYLQALISTKDWSLYDPLTHSLSILSHIHKHGAVNLRMYQVLSLTC